MSRSDPSHRVMITRASLGRDLQWTLDYGGFGLFLMVYFKDLVGHKNFGGPTIPLTYHGFALEKTVPDETAF